MWQVVLKDFCDTDINDFKNPMCMALENVTKREFSSMRMLGKIFVAGLEYGLPGYFYFGGTLTSVSDLAVAGCIGTATIGGFAAMYKELKDRYFNVHLPAAGMLAGTIIGVSADAVMDTGPVMQYSMMFTGMVVGAGISEWREYRHHLRRRYRS
jgi:hypothetical protein